MVNEIEKLIQAGTVEQTLFRGSAKKSAVKSLQNSLFEMGFGTELKWNGSADGDFGPATASAVVAFANLNQLAGQSGSPVSKTVAAKIVQQYQILGDLRIFQGLLHRQALGSVVKSRQRNPLARSLQRLLNALGANLVVDGFYGNGTATAVRQFGQQVGISTDGESVDESLATKLIEKIVPFFGKDWATAKVGRYYQLEPVGQNDFKQIKRLREQLRTENTRKFGRRKYRYEFTSITDQVEGENLDIDIEMVKKFGEDGKQIISYHYQEGEKEGRNGPSNVKHDRIVLHFTVGVDSGDLRTLTEEDWHVSTAFLVGRDGTIYQLFSPHQWSFHLGPGAVASHHNSRGIGIEMANLGPLKEAPGASSWKLVDDYGQVYCGKENVEAYTELPKPYRDHTYYCTHTEKQYQSLIILLRYLTKEFPQIPRTFIDTDKDAEARGDWDSIPRYRVFQGNEAEEFRGICSHVNYRRPNEKFDIGPAFDWDKLIAGVTISKFKVEESLVVRTRSIFSGPKKMSQQDIRKEMAKMDYGEQDSGMYGPGGPEVDI